MPPAPPGRDPPPRRGTDEELIAASGLLDVAWIRKTYPDIAEAGADPLAHFAGWGWREGRQPNLVFRHPLVPAAERRLPPRRRQPAGPLHPLRGGRKPLARPASTCPGTAPTTPTRPTSPRAARCSAHFLLRRLTGEVSPLAEFDAAWYLQRYPDIAEAGVDPFEHYLLWGWREGRNPSARLRHRLLRAPLPRSRAGREPAAALPPAAPRRPPAHPPPGSRERCVRGGAPLHPAGARLRGSAPPARLGAAAGHGAGLLPAAVPPDRRERPWWGTGFTEWTSLARGAAALRRPLPATGAARPRPLHGSTAPRCCAARSSWRAAPGSAASSSTSTGSTAAACSSVRSRPSSPTRRSTSRSA